MDLLLLDPNMEDYDGIKQGCHHLQTTSINNGEKPHSNVTFNPDTTSVLTTTAVAFAQGYPSLSGALVLGRLVKGDETDVMLRINYPTKYAR